jgi:holliday junction DNA helicase RuvA
MIGRLRGRVIERQAPFLLLELDNGIAYEIQAPLSLFYHLPAPEVVVSLYTHLNVREDALTLYAFIDINQRRLFRDLIKINGVGPKLALTILSSMDVATFVDCVYAQDLQTLTRMPGVGKKTAERLLIEMQDKLVDWQPQAGLASQLINRAKLTSAVPASAEKEALTALVGLGYKPQEASRLVGGVEGVADKSVEEIIKLALKQVLPAKRSQVTE